MPEPIKKPLRFIRNLLIKPDEVRKQSPEESKLRARFKNAQQRGYDFHQKSVANNPDLLEWVLKDDYWDYQLPIINQKQK